MKLLAVLPLLLLMLTFARYAAAQTCKRSPAVTGKCAVVTGSLGLTRGTGVTLDTDDGRRVLIKAPPESNADIPRAVMQRWMYWQSRTRNMDTRIKGRYELCPLPGPDGADYACIASGSHITADKSPTNVSD
jgi:hypothetical protein